MLLYIAYTLYSTHHTQKNYRASTLHTVDLNYSTMENSRKRRPEPGGDENSSFYPIFSALTKNDIYEIIQPFTRQQLLETLHRAATRHLDILDLIISVADNDVTRRKLFISGLAGETESPSLVKVFSDFGPIEEVSVIKDRVTGRSKGYGFVTFRHVDSAITALKEPCKMIDGIITESRLADRGEPKEEDDKNDDVSKRRVFVGNLPSEGVKLPSTRLMAATGFSADSYSSEQQALQDSPLCEPIMTPPPSSYSWSGEQALQDSPLREPMMAPPPSPYSWSGGEQGQYNSPLHAPIMTPPPPSLSYGDGPHQGHAMFPGNDFMMQEVGPNMGGDDHGYGHGIGGSVAGYGGSFPPTSSRMSAPVPEQSMMNPRLAPQGWFQGRPPY